MADNDDYMVPKAYDDAISELMWDRLQEGINANRRFRLRGVAGGDNMRYSSTKVVWDSDIYIYFTRESDGAWVYNKINTNPTTGITCGNDDILYVTLNDTTATVLTVSSADYTAMPTDDTGRILVLGSVRDSRWYGVSSTDISHDSILGVSINDHHDRDHDNTEHSTNYEVYNANIQSHVGTPPTDSHHTRYADSEVESVITAELVEGQSIDNAIDALILTHKNIAGAHHTKTTLFTDLTDDIVYTQLNSIVDTSGGGATNLISRADHVHTATDGSSKITYTDLLSIPSTFTPSNHDIITKHTDTGLTVGYVIRASGASAFAWAQLSHSDLNDDESTQHFLQSAITTVGTLDSSGDVRAADSIGKVASKAKGDIFYWNTVLARLGTTGANAGDVLTLSNDPPDGLPFWNSPSAFMGHSLDSVAHTDVPAMTEAEGDIIIRSGSSTWIRLAKGIDGYTLEMTGNLPGWVNHTSVSAHHTKYVLTDDLASTEITAIQNINTVTIINDQWAYVGDLDQALTSTSNVTFGTISGTGELDLTGTGACIDLNPSGTGAKNIIDITPSAAIGAVTWRGFYINGAALDPTASTAYIEGITIDFTGVSMSNNPQVHGIVINMPATYGSSIENAGTFSGDGKLVRICTDDWALHVDTGNIRLDGTLQFDSSGNAVSTITTTMGTPANSQLISALGIKTYVDAAAGTDYDPYLMIGVANATWIPTTAMFGFLDSSITTGGYYPRNLDGTDFWLAYGLHLPTTLEDKKLYIKGCKISVVDANVSNYIQKYHVVGMRPNQTYNIVYQEDSTGNSGSEMLEDGTGGMVAWGTADDMSGYLQAVAAIWCVVNAFANLSWSAPLLECYYDD